MPGCEKAFIARTSPPLNIRRGRLIDCDYDITHEDVIEGRHFDDDVMAYGFHDMAPALAGQERRHLRHSLPGPAREAASTTCCAPA